MAEITIPGMFLAGDHASRPAASAVGGGALYACSDHTKLYQSDGSSWSDWFDPTGLAGGAAPTPWAIMPTGVAANITNRAIGANNAIYVPCIVEADCEITGIRFIVGTSNGNVDVGLYDTSANRLASAGSTACPATGPAVIGFSAAYSAVAGRYYLAIATSSSSATFGYHQQVSSGVTGPIPGIYQNTAFPLPDPGTISAANVTSSPALIGRVTGGFP